MSKKLFLSHDSRDEALAKVLAETIERLSLRQLTIWFSSDRTSNGGFQPGAVWLDAVRTNLSKSKAVIALLTPRSLPNSWLLFECGYGAATQGREVIPVAVGIDALSEIPFPLGMFQGYQLTDYDSIKTLVSKLFALYDVAFDEELAKPALEKAITQISVLTPKRVAQKETTRSIEDVERSIKAHIDTRLGSLVGATRKQAHARAARYSVSIEIRFPPLSADNYLEISEHTTVQDVLDNVYYMISDHVKSFRYLTEWILYNKTSSKFLVIREVGDLIPARFVFERGSVWEVQKLSVPYSPERSKDFNRWYRTTKP